MSANEPGGSPMRERDVTRFTQLVLLHDGAPDDAPPFERLASGVLYRDRRASPEAVDAFGRDWREVLGDAPPRREVPDDVSPEIVDPDVIARRERRREELKQLLERDANEDRR